MPAVATQPVIRAKGPFLGLNVVLEHGLPEGRQLADEYRKWAYRNLPRDHWIRGFARDGRRIEFICHPDSPGPVLLADLEVYAASFAATIRAGTIRTSPTAEVPPRIIVGRVSLRGAEKWVYVPRDALGWMNDRFSEVRTINLIDLWHNCRVGEMNRNFAGLSGTGFELVCPALTVDKVLDFALLLFGPFKVGPVVAHVDGKTIIVDRHASALASGELYC